MSFNFDHPAAFVAAEDLKLIERESEPCRRTQHLTPALVDLFVRRRWLRVFIPREVDGDEWEWPDALRLLEAVSWADGGVGWALNLAAGGNIFAGYFPLALSQAWFSIPHAWVAGSGSVGGVAMAGPSGYRVHGRWPFVTGAPHASIFTVICRLESRSDKTIALALQPQHVRLEPGWDGLGLHSSATHAIVVEDATVPAAHILPLDDLASHVQRPLYQLPFDVFAVPTLAASVSGCALRLMDDVLADEGLAGASRDAVAATQEALGQARQVFYRALESAWQEVVARGQMSHDHTRALFNTSRQLNRVAQQCAAVVYQQATMEVVMSSTPLCRRWCDLVTAAKHRLLRA